MWSSLITRRKFRPRIDLFVMPLRNRVLPNGEIVAISARGAFMGNRGGAIHNDQRAIIRPYASRRWITGKRPMNPSFTFARAAGYWVHERNRRFKQSHRAQRILA
jgi:hypothetical protein